MSVIEKIRSSLKELINSTTTEIKELDERLYEIELKLFDALRKIFEPIISKSADEFHVNLEIPHTCVISVSGGRGKLGGVAIYPMTDIRLKADEMVTNDRLKERVANILALSRVLNRPELMLEAIEELKKKLKVDVNRIEDFIKEIAEENAKWILSESV